MYRTVKQALVQKNWFCPNQTVNISDEFEADLDDMFKLESGNEYRWLNKGRPSSPSNNVARELRLAASWRNFTENLVDCFLVDLLKIN